MNDKETKEIFQRLTKGLTPFLNKLLNTDFLYHIADKNFSTFTDNFMVFIRKSDDYEVISELVKTFLKIQPERTSQGFLPFSVMLSENENCQKKHLFTTDYVVGILGGMFKAEKSFCDEHGEYHQYFLKDLAMFLAFFICSENSLIKKAKKEFEQRRDLQEKLSSDIIQCKNSFGLYTLSIELAYAIKDKYSTAMKFELDETIIKSLLKKSFKGLDTPTLIKLFASAHEKI